MPIKTLLLRVLLLDIGVEREDTRYLAMKLASSASAPMVSMVINNKKKMEKHCRPLRHASTRADLGLFEANFTIEQKDELAKRVKHRVDKITYALHA